jgi:hypothetical protein
MSRLFILIFFNVYDILKRNKYTFYTIFHISLFFVYETYGRSLCKVYLILIVQDETIRLSLNKTLSNPFLEPTSITMLAMSLKSHAQGKRMVRSGWELKT